MPESKVRVGRGHGSKIARRVALAGAATTAAAAAANKERKNPTPEPIKFTKPAMNWRRAGKFAAAGGVATGGAAYLYHQRQKDKTVAKYYDPFSDETVEFGKSFRDKVWPKMDRTPSKPGNFPHVYGTRARTAGLGAVGAAGTGILIRRQAKKDDEKSVGKADGNGTKLMHVRRTGRQMLSNGTTLTHVRKGFASQAFVNQPASTRMVSAGHSMVNANQRSAQNLQIFRGKNTTIKTKSPLKLVRR